jgi:hypothetical protein
MRFVRDISWPQITEMKARLTYLKGSCPGTFYEHREFLLRTWPDIYKNTFESEFKKKYNDYVSHLEHFCGCCKQGEIINIVSTGKSNVVVFSKNLSSETVDHSDIELWLRKSTKLPFLGQGELSCEIYSFGTVVILPHSEEAFHGAKQGKSRVSHQNGIYSVAFDNNNFPKKITLHRLSGYGADNAIFELV